MKPINPDEYVTVWSRGYLASHWVIERSYTLRYVCSDLGLIHKPGHCKQGDDMRRYLWLPKGVDPNDLPPLLDSAGNPTIYVDTANL